VKKGKNLSGRKSKRCIERVSSGEVGKDMCIGRAGVLDWVDNTEWVDSGGVDAGLGGATMGNEEA